MASLDLATLRVEIEADNAQAIQQIRQTGEAAKQAAAEAEAAEMGYHKNASGRLAGAKGRYEELGRAATDAAGTAADAFEKAGAAGAGQVEGFSKKADASLKRVQEKLSEIGKDMTTKLTLPIVTAFTASVKSASDLEETVSKTGEVFKDQSDRVMEWSQNSIETMGLAQGTALDMASSFGDMGSSMGQTRAEASEMSTSLVQLAADMASFKNISTERAASALTAIYTGETEALKSLGIVMTQANLEAYALSQGITTQVSAMSQAEQVQLRYQYVMAQTANAQGDFVRTGGSLANQSRKLVQSIKQMGESFGKLLLPMVTKVVSALQKAAQWLAEDESGLKGTMVAIAGIVAAIGPLLLAGGKVLKLVQSIQTATGALMAHPIALAIGAAAVALAAIRGSIQAVDEEAIRATDAYKALKTAVEGGASGEITLDTSQIDEANSNPPKLYITGDVQGALEAAKGIANTLSSEEYAANVAIDGDTQKGNAALEELLAAIEAAEAAITIDGDGNPVIGDEGAIVRLQNAINAAGGLMSIGVNDESYAAADAQIEALRKKLAQIGVNIEISTNKEKFDADVDALNSKLQELGWKKYGGYGEFSVSESTQEEIDEYAAAIAAAAQAIHDYDEAVSNLDNMVDRKIAEQTGEIHEQTAEQVLSLGRAYNSGVLSYDEYIEKAGEVYAAGEEQIRQLEKQGELQKELNKTYADGNKKNDAPTAAQQSLDLLGGEGLNTEDAQNAAAVLAEAAAAGEEMSRYQTEAMIVNNQLKNQAIENYDAMIAAQEAYDAAIRSADDKETNQLAEVDDQIATYQQIGDAIERYRMSLEAGQPAQEAFNNAIADLDADAVSALEGALAGEDGELATSGEAISAAAMATVQSIADAEAAKTELQASANAERLSAEQAFADSMTAIAGELSAKEIATLTALTAATGQAMSEADAQLVNGMQGAVDAMISTLGSGEEGAVSEVAGMISAIGNETSAARKEGDGIGKAIVNGIIAGANSRSGALETRLSSIISAGIRAAKATAQVNSPSKVTMREIGAPLMEGIEVGFSKRLPQALRTIKGDTEALMSGAASVADGKNISSGAAVSAASRTALDYERLADAVSSRALYFNVGTRQLAQATSDSNARAQTSRARSLAIGYGKG